MKLTPEQIDRMWLWGVVAAFMLAVALIAWDTATAGT